MYKILFLDDDNNYVPKEKATKFIKQYYDENGKLIEEKIGITKNYQKHNNEEIKISQDILDYLDNYQDKDGNYLFRK